MVRFATLCTEQDFAQFKASYDGQIAARSGGLNKSTVSLDYLRLASRPIGCFDRKGRLVAGWVLQECEPMIVLAAMSEAAREAFLARAPRETLCELTAIWRNEGISADRFAWIVWPRIIVDCVTCGRPRILGVGYDNTMNEIYRRIRPELIYRGPHQARPDTEIFVYAYTRATMTSTFFANLFVRKVRPMFSNVIRRR